MSDLREYRVRAQAALLDIFTKTTTLPIGLYERRGGQEVATVSELSYASFEPHCRYIQTLPGGREMCERDQCDRATAGMNSGADTLSLCYAGMYNQIVPVTVHGSTRGVLSYGEMQVDSEDHRGRSMAKHAEAVERLGLSADQAANLQRLLQGAKVKTLTELEEIKAHVRTLEEWFYALIDEEDALRLSIDRVTHDIQTRLQAIIGSAENLTRFRGRLLPEKAQSLTQQILHNAIALDTVIQTLGEYLEEYRFERSSLKTLIEESRNVYEVQARQRNIDIRIDLPPDGIQADISRHHLQHAFNNLVHNAVKYSFKGAPGRERYVHITGKREGNECVLTFSNYGVGILAEEIATRAIFENDYQGRLTLGEYRTGSGKGLYFVKRVVDKHGGRIEVKSTLAASEPAQQGNPHHTRFTVHLPIRRDPDGRS